MRIKRLYTFHSSLDSVNLVDCTMHTKIILLCVFVHISVGNVVLDKYLWKTWKNNTFYAFRGIKYAESPTGSLRFKVSPIYPIYQFEAQISSIFLRKFQAPQPAKTWNNINAIIDQSLNRDGSDCPSPGVSYDEDCLFLNVYTKNWGVSKNPMPVVVFIHPGGFYIGSGSSTNHGPEYLLEEDVVLVTFNYRLAYFGFTSTGTNEAIGNAGFKDQALALQWVHDHIRYFGGDPDSVTLAGDSAGGMSVQLHMISPLSQNLFHRAFVMSGGVLPQYKHNSSQPYLIEKLARLIGCPDSEKPFDCIKRADTATITDQLRATFEFGWDNPVYPWLPIVEAPGGNEKPFLCEDPMKLFEERKFNRIPVLLSLTKDETTMSAMYLFEHRELLAQWINDFQRLGPLCMQYDANDTITKAFQERYVRYEFEDEEHYLELFVDSAQVGAM